VHRKPYLIRNILEQLIPLLYAETVVKEELIHTVEMGPFKHKVDDGLEIRKVINEIASNWHSSTHFVRRLPMNVCTLF
jgi:cullin-associated NEDD8-dissociated protein 1